MLPLLSILGHFTCVEMPVILPRGFGRSGGHGRGTSQGSSHGCGGSEMLAVSVGTTLTAASISIDVSTSSNAASLQCCLNALACTEQADKDAIANWKRRIRGEMDDKYE